MTKQALSTSKDFSFSTSQNIICEWGGAARLADICQGYSATSVLLITDRGIKQLGLYQTALDSFKQASIRVEVFSEVQADPSESVVHAALALAKQQQAELIIGFGGGSSLDVAKIVALLAHPQCQQSLGDIYGVGNAKGERLPLVQVPTTAGTGSEVTQVAIVTTGETTKAGIVTPLFLPDMALLDAELTVNLPSHVSAATGIDAMVHAIEAYTSKIKKNPISDLLAKEALALMGRNIFKAVHQGQDRAAREAMLLGAMLAGQAFANAPVAAVHALAYPLGGHFHIPHGLSNSLVLPHVLRFNSKSVAQQYAELAPIVFSDCDFEGDAEEIAEQFIQQIEALIKRLDLPTKLKEMDIPESFLPRLADDAMLQTRLLINNPRDVTRQDAQEIYQAAFG
jgi:alcohol dehydrogenase class IV